MKIGILTFHIAPNCGAALQAFALMNFLRQKGHDVSIVDYQCPGNDDSFSPSKLFSIKNIKPTFKFIIYFIVSNLLLKKKYILKYEAFKKFQNKNFVFVQLGKTCFDAIICGSDQIWNPFITNGLKKIYFGLINNENQIKKIAYAASCGDVKSLSSNDRKALISYARQMDCVSVREKTLDILLNTNGVKSEVVLDPTFLLTKENYVEYFCPFKSKEKDYILVYDLRKTPIIKETAKKIAKEKKISLVYIYGYNKILSFGHNHICSAGPKEFINYIANAKYVITDSFHGLAFSLIFEKDFSICLPSIGAERLTSLLDSINLLNRIVYQAKKIESSPINYEFVNFKKNSLINLSKSFIDKALM